MTQRIVYEQHMHTPLCRHAEGEPERYAETAWRRGLRGIVVTCHNPMPASYMHSGRMEEWELDTYMELVDRTRRAYDGLIDVRVGLECDFFPGYERYVEEQLAGRGFEHVLGSVHPFLSVWLDKFGAEGPEAAQRHYFRQLAETAETGLFDTIAHPDLIKNVHPRNWDIERLLPDIRAALDRIAATGVAMELNTSGLLKHVAEMNPNPVMLKEMHQRGIPVVVGADAHVPQRVAADFEQAYDLLEAAGYTHVSYFLERQRHELPIAAARASLVAVEPPEPAEAR